MAKKFLFVLLLGVLHSSSVLATGEPIQPTSVIVRAEACNAAPPDSFRVKSNGGSFITLAWNPIWINATHELTVSKKDENGNWITQYTLPDVPGSSILIDGLEGEKSYKFQIATKCSSGEASELTSVFEHIASIVELTLAGRTPLSPTAIPCIGIPYRSYEWVGFSVSGEDALSIFEIVINENSYNPIAYINRVYDESSTIVAANDEGESPNSIFPEIHNVFLPFHILNTANNAPKIGSIDLIVHPGKPPTIDLCVSTSTPWKNGYIFTTLTTESVIMPWKGFKSNLITNRIEAHNPIKDNIQILVPQPVINSGAATIQLLDVNGRTILFQKLDYLSSEVSIPVEWLPAGVYILNIKTNTFIQSLKVLKSN